MFSIYHQYKSFPNFELKLVFFLKIKQKHLKVVALFEVLGWYMLLWNSLIY